MSDQEGTSCHGSVVVIHMIPQLFFDLRDHASGCLPISSYESSL